MDENIFQTLYNRLVADVVKALKSGNREQLNEEKSAYADVNFTLPDHVLEVIKNKLEEMEDGESELLLQAKSLLDQGRATPEQVSKAALFFRNNPLTSLSDEHMLLGEDGGGKAYKWWKDTKRSMERVDAQNINPTGFVVEKDASGNWRWFGWATNNFVDREEEIITDSAHIEFRDFLDENPQYAPELWTWHTPGTSRKHRADWWDYANGFFVYSGILTEEEAEGYKNVSEEEIGMSHGFYVLERKGPYILRYRTFEVSDLPLELAANPYTTFTYENLEEEKEMFSDRKRAYLVAQFGEDKVAQLEGKTEEQEKILQDLGVTRKELDSQYEEHLENELAQKIADASTDRAEAIVKDVASEVIELLNIPQLQETLAMLNEGIQANKAFLPRIEALEEHVKQLQETEDQKIADALTSHTPLSWQLQGSKSVETVVEEEELTEEEKEEVEKATGTVSQFDWIKSVASVSE